MTNPNTASQLINYPCSVCCQATSLWCSRCQASWYCSAEHMSQDWPRHRRECIPVNAPLNAVIPTPPLAQPQVTTVSAIYFHPDEDRPRIIPLRCQPPATPTQGSCPTPLVAEYFPGNHVQNVVLTQGLNGEPLRFPLHLWYSPGALQAGVAINRAIYRITSGAAARPWCGPVIVLKYNGSRRQGYADAGSNDLPALSAYFLAYK
ncbi:hypothetical protein PENSPDRAFT_581180 [Peniophora sp. CONT]|nr:hypothetical protein PENSPDRAFT_581180 [Peniophora sp. CONT]